MRRLFFLLTAFTLAVFGAVVAPVSPAHATTPSCTSTPGTWTDLQTAMLGTGTSGSPNVVCLGADLVGAADSSLRITHLQHVVLDLNGYSLTITAGSARAGIDTNSDAYLTIQDSNPGLNVLNVTGGDSGAGIGGSTSATGGSVTINSGNIISSGGFGHSGIGSQGAGGNVTINGGTIRAVGGTNGAGIGGKQLSDGGSITINGGTITAIGGALAAGIGGGVHESGGSITINDGNVTATGGDLSGAGIGGGDNGSGGSITINNGTVYATGGSGTGAGIGGGGYNNGGVITVNGGFIQSQGGQYGAGMGGGSGGAGGTITINSGVVLAQGTYGAAIGGGLQGDGATLLLTGGRIQAFGGFGPHIGSGFAGANAGTLAVRTENLSSLANFSTIASGVAPITTTSTPTAGAAAISVSTFAIYSSYTYVFNYSVSFNTGGGSSVTQQEVPYGTRPAQPTAPTRAGYAMDTWRTGSASGPGYDFSTGTSITSATTLYASWGLLDTTCNSVNKPTTWADLTGSVSSATSSNSSSANPKVVCLGGDISTTGNHLTIASGAYVALDLNGYSLSISAENYHAAIETSTAFLTVQDSRPGLNLLTVIGGRYSAAIGGWTDGSAGRAGGTLTINAGNIRATGGNSAAGIGGSWQGAGGSITINGGTISSTGGDYGAGIGGGYFRDSGTITINGGTIAATGGHYAAGIGGGNFGNGGVTVISGGTISATGGVNGAGFGGGYARSGGSITVTSGNVSANGGQGAAAIGGGINGDGGAVSLSGGHIHAVRWDISSAVIGSGSGGSQAGTLTVTTVEPVSWVNSNMSGSAGRAPTTSTTSTSVSAPAKSVSRSELNGEVTFSFNYEVSFDSGGGSSVTQQEVGYGERPSQPSTPTRAGYAMASWQVGSASGPVYDFNTSTPITAATTLYASWNAITASPLSINAGTRAVNITQTDRKVGSSWDVSVHSTPVSIGSGITSGSAAVIFSGTIPAVTAGVHHVEVSSTASNNVTAIQKLWFVCDQSGAIVGVYATEAEANAAWAALQPSTARQANTVSALSSTGLDVSRIIQPFLAGIGLLILGLALFAWRRRRSY